MKLGEEKRIVCPKCGISNYKRIISGMSIEFECRGCGEKLEGIGER